MEVQVTLFKEDYKKFLKEHFKKEAGKRLYFFIVFLFLWVSLSIISNQHSTFQFSQIIIQLVIILSILLTVTVIIPYLIGKIKLRKFIKKIKFPQSKQFVTEENGITIISEDEKTFWIWESLMNADIINECMYFVLFNNKYHLIPLRCFSSENEAINFLGIIKNGILKVRGQNRYRKIRNLYYWGILGIVPNVGAIAGIVLVIKGFQYNDKKLVTIGIADVTFTVIFWTLIFPYLLKLN